MKGVILEGVTGAGKSRISSHLQRILASDAPSNTKLFLGEHYTDRVLEHLRDGGKLTPAHVLVHLHRITSVLSPLRVAKADSKFAGRDGNTTVLVVIERFLLGHIASMTIAEPGSWSLAAHVVDAMAALYQNVRDCGLHTVVLRIAPEALGERVLSTRRYRNAAWRDYLARQGDDDAIVRYHGALQGVLLDYCGTLQAIVQPTFVDVGADWGDHQYAAAASDLARRFLAR